MYHLDDTNIFEEGTESPLYVDILYNCYQNLEKKVDDIFELSCLRNEAQIKLINLIKFINEKIEKVEEGRKEKEKHISELKNEVKQFSWCERKWEKKYLHSHYKNLRKKKV